MLRNIRIGARTSGTMRSEPWSGTMRHYGQALIDFGMIAVLWSASSVGYFQIRDLLGLTVGYMEAPILYSAYYLAFSTLAVILFRHRLRDWEPRAHGPFPVLAVILMIAVFTIWVLPALPEIDMSRAPHDPPEFMFANAMYYVAKSFEILFQQILILTIVLTLATLCRRMWQVSVLTALLFGLFHLALIYNGATPFYVARFTVAATCFGAVVPSLLLATRNGATLSLGLHWAFYVADNVYTHFVLAAPG